ncbi:DJ-1/PfpI family protein [Pseudonocardia humida]|uniref:DJ-1/PfpI family protein n=1 Tax=Pseudonocardia humida TaxID=2800819 RepID=A0ABT1A0A2_9PSEU|nr:DJ-1/PfpI family protein [Pseudonocardia humida]MCO1656424.1 DJ-1/PfpI family protein [Pseudonocardia humida]
MQNPPQLARVEPPPGTAPPVDGHRSRRDEYAAGHYGVRWALDGRRVVRGLVRGLVVLLAFLAVPAAVYTAGSTAYEQSRYAPPDAPGGAADAGAPVPAHDPARPTAVVVVGNGGANVADALVPYDVLAGTGAFNVYTVAPERRALPLLGGLDLVPHLSFAQLRERLGGAAPEVTVVPEMPVSGSDAEVTGWLRDTAGGGLVLGVCTGARLLADAGLLDGRPATTHWYRMDGLQQRHPQVDWQRGVRYVDDGDVITTGGLLSSVDGTLRVIERLLGTDAAAKAADAVGWPGYSPGTAAALPGSRVAPSEGILHLLNIGFRANGTTVGVVLSDGVGELELASAFAPYGEVKSARTLALAAGGDSIRSRHGLTFVPRADLDAAGRTDRLLVPGLAARPDPDVAAAARRAGVPVVQLHQQPGFAFEAALRDMAATTDVATTRWAAKILEYSQADLRPAGPAWPWAPALQVLFLGLVGVAAALAVEQVVRRVRAGRS